MIDRTKKQTNLGIALAIIGFAMVGGALVLIPRLVDEKIKSLRLIESPSDRAAVAEKLTRVATPLSAGNTSDAGVAPDTGLPKAAGKSVRPNSANQPSTSQAESAPTEGVTTPSAGFSTHGPWELVLVDKYEPDAPSAATLQGIIEKMKSTPGMRIKIVGINNINKMSKLAQIAANRIQASILKEAGVVIERIETGTEQKEDVSGIRVQITELGGAQ